LQYQRKYAEAGFLYQKALDSSRRVLGEDHLDTASGYTNVAVNLSAQGNEAEAEPMFRKALEISRKVLGEDHPETAQSYRNLAISLKAQGKYQPALMALEAGAQSYDAARPGGAAAAALDRADFGARQSPYLLLSMAWTRAGQAAKAWAALEADLARGLLDELALRRGIGLTPAQQRQCDDLRTQRTSLEPRIVT